MTDTLEQYFSDDKATGCLARAESDPDAAKDALLIAAEYIRRGEALPGNLADYLAGAIETAMLKPEKFRAKALTDELNLTANNRRQAGNVVEIGEEVEKLINEGSTQNAAFSMVAENHNTSKAKVSEETVRRYWREYIPKLREFYEGIKSSAEKAEAAETIKKVDADIARIAKRGKNRSKD